MKDPMNPVATSLSMLLANRNDTKHANRDYKRLIKYKYKYTILVDDALKQVYADL